MSTANPASDRPASVAAKPMGKAEALIWERLAEARSALWWAELIRAVLRIVIVGMLALVAWLIIDQWIYSPGILVRSLAFCMLVGWVVRELAVRVVPILRSSIRLEYAARSLERDIPELRQNLTSYVTLRDEGNQGGLANRVLRTIGSTAAGQLRSHDQLPHEATGTLRWWIAAAATFALLAAYAVISPKNSFQSASRLIAPVASIEPARRVLIRDVEPGNAEAMAGRELEVSARITGMSESEQAYVRWQSDSNERTSALEWNSDTQRHQGEISLTHSASGEVEYFIEAGDAIDGPYHLQVKNVPVVAVQSVRYQPPPYTGELPHTSSSGSISAVDGTSVTVRATTNRAVEKANIEFNPKPLGETVRATAGATELEIVGEGTELLVTFPLRSAKGRSAAVELESYRIKVWDAAGQSNPDPIIYPIQIIPDLPPEVSIVLPRQSPKEVPIDAQQLIEVHALDADYGLKQVRLEINIGLNDVDHPVLWSDPDGARGNRVSEYPFRPAELGLEVGDVVQVRAVATDNRASQEDPRIEPNVSKTDAIELKIVASQPLPNDPNQTDGLSPPDQRAAGEEGASKSEPNEDAGGEGSTGQSGGGGSGSGTESGGEGQSQDGQGQGESAESGQGQEGQGQSGAGGEQEGSAGNESAQQNQNDRSGDPSDANQGSGDQPGNQESAAGEGSGTQSDSADQRQPGNQGGAGDQASDGSQGQAAETEPGTGAESGGDAGSPSPSGDPSGNNGSGQTPSGAGQPQGQRGSGGSNDGPPKPPRHDGEAFERIREYVKEKQNQSRQQGAGGESGSPEGDAGTERSDQGTPSPAADPSQAGAGADQQGSTDRQQGGGGSNGDETAQASDRQQGDPTGAENAGAADDRQASSEAGNREQGGEPKKAGEPGAGEPGEGGAGQSGEQASQDADQRAGGEQGSGGGEAGQQSDQTTAQQGTGSDSSSGESGGSSDQGSGQQGSGQPESGEAESGETGDRSDSSESGDAPQQEAGEQGRQESGAGDEGNSNRQDRDAGDTTTTRDGAPGSEAGESGSSDQAADSGAGDSGRPEQTQRPAESEPSSDAQPPRDQGGNRAPADAVSGSGSGGEGTAREGDVPTPPDPVDLEYAKQATDMVLDYLEQTRDAPDRELLDELNWTEEDLKRFADRWSKVREMETSGDPEQSPRLEEALQSLGLRKPTQSTQNRREAADELRGVRDSGNRRPVPAAHRDAFEAFRRAIGQQRSPE